MMTLLATVLALFIAAYGLLLVVGGGPRLANKLPHALGRMALDSIHGLLRGLIQLLLTVLAAVTEFVFNRPRR